MPDKKKKKHCWKCQGSHSPPTGHKCNQIPAKTVDEFWERNLDPADVAIGLWTDEWSDLRKEEEKAKDDQNWPDMNGHSPSRYPEWSQDSNSKPLNVRPHTDWRPKFREFHGDRVNRDDEVALLKEDVALLRDEARSSRDKLADIEHLLRSSLPAVNVLARDYRAETSKQPDPPNKKPDEGQSDHHVVGGRQGRSRQRERRTLPHPRHIDSSPTATSPYGSSDTSSSSEGSTNREYRQRKSHRDDKNKNSHRRYKLSKYLPKEERSKPMTTERLWFCHGALMLDHYVKGYNIEGMLRRNVFIAEKSASRAYLPSGIVKYDEAIRDIARRDGGGYSGGNMEVAMRFLSVEYARPKSGSGQGSGNGSKQSQVRKSASTQGKDNKCQCCWAFNSSGCYYENCKYPHLCNRCFGSGHNQHSCRGTGYVAPVSHTQPQNA